MSKEKDIIDSIISQNCHGNERLCQDVKNAINEIAFDTNYTEQERKEAYNTFYTKLLNSTGDDQKYSIDDLCYLAKKKKKMEKKKNVHLWGKSQYTDEIAKMYNILTSSLAVLCNSRDRCNFEDMKNLQLEILKKTKKIEINKLHDIGEKLKMIRPNGTVSVRGDRNSGSEKEGYVDSSEEEGYVEYITSVVSIFKASSEYINENLKTLIEVTPEYTVDIISSMIRKMIDIMRRVSRMDVVGSAFHGFECYNRFLISAIGNKLATIFNSVLLAGITASIGISAGYAVLVDTLNEQNLLQLAATLYYYSEFINPTMEALSAAVDLGDSIKIHLMTKIPNLAKEKIDIAANTIRYYIDKLAKPTEDMTLEHTENVVKDITNITEIIEKAIPMINEHNVIVENDEQILLIAGEARELLESYLNDNAEQAGQKEGGPGQRKPGGGKKHKKSHKKRHQKTHKKQLKPKAKSHKKKNKPKAKSHKKK